jgi:hypothetical protein
MTNHFHVIDPQGVAHTRSSKNRTYTHTVLFFRGEAYAERSLKSALDFATKQAPRDYRYAQARIDGRKHAEFVAKFPTLYIEADGTPSEYAVSERAKDIAEGTAEIGGLDLAAYTAKCQERARASHAREVAQGYFNTWVNMGWCGRADLARKLAETIKGAEQVKILEAQVGKPTKPVKAAA